MIRKSQVYLAVIIAAVTITGITLLNVNQGILNYSNDVTPLSVGNEAEDIQTSAPETHEYTMVMKETTVEIAPGVRVLAWAYNGTIPGPTVRVTEGDRVITHFINNSTTTHTIHFHGDHNSINDGVFEEVLPNETFTYDFIATPAGAMMYHCHVMPVTLHIRNGMYGAFIIDPKTPLEAAREYVLVMGEYDTQDQMTETPQYVMLNGYVDQYMSNPLPARVNETVRIYFINISASPAWGFHIHGTTFKAWPAGLWQNPPLKVMTYAVSAGDTAIFEATWPWEGRYLFHIHGTPEEKGTLGYFDVTEAPGDAMDGLDVSITKSISMIGWQEDLLKELQAEDPDGQVSTPKKSVYNEGENGEGKTDIIESTMVSAPVDSAKASLRITFEPEKIRVNLGDTVTWTNDDSAVHTVTNIDEIFDSAIMKPGDIFTYTFEKGGTFDYVCTLHPWMTGRVIVT